MQEKLGSENGHLWDTNSLIVYYYGSSSFSYCHDNGRNIEQEKDGNAAEKQDWL